MRLAHDLTHYYSTHFRSADAHCRLRIYRPDDVEADGTTPGVLPVVILTELPDNKGMSVTNMVERLAAQILLKYLQDRVRAEIPFILIEQYAPSDGVRNSSSYSQVTFANWQLYSRANGLPSVGTPTWTRITRERLADILMGAPLEEYPELDHLSPIAETLTAEQRMRAHQSRQTRLALIGSDPK